MSLESLMIVQGGGPTAVFNQSLASIITEARQHPNFKRILGARSGTRGLATGDILDLASLQPSDLRALASSPGAALGSSRFQPTGEDLEHCVHHLRRLQVRYLLFLGGNGTMRGAAIVRDACRAMHYELQVVGVPKTIDNDIAATDRCPGFGSAARFVAQATLDLAADICSLPAPVSIFETLGRDVGWLAAASTFARLDPGDAPHLVYIPEIPFSRDHFLADVDRVVTRLGWAVVVVSEGLVYADSTPVFVQRIDSEKNKGNRPLIGGVAQHLSGVVAAHLGIRCRSEKPGLIGRCSTALVSAQDRADAELVGREGVRALAQGRTSVMVALRSLAEQDGPGFELIPLDAAAGIRRPIPAAWLAHNLNYDPGNPSHSVAGSLHHYLKPIIGELSRYPSVLLAQAKSAG